MRTLSISVVIDTTNNGDVGGSVPRVTLDRAVRVVTLNVEFTLRATDGSVGVVSDHEATTGEHVAHEKVSN
jgi:hypothetical protein